jgi:hypothetical protein
MFCKNCQKEISDDSKFCEFCGENVRQCANSQDVELSTQGADFNKSASMQNGKHPKLIELDGKPWYRFLKVLYFIGMIICLILFFFWSIDESYRKNFISWDDFWFMFLSLTVATILTFETLKRSFYYVLLGSISSKR